MFWDKSTHNIFKCQISMYTRENNIEFFIGWLHTTQNESLFVIE
jgi:hypothetical protein